MNNASTLWDNFDPGFSQPIWLYLIPLVILILGLFEWATFRYRRKALSYFVAPHLVPGLTRGVSQRKRFIKAGLLALAVCLIFIALARPHLFFIWRQEISSGIDLLFAVDCSKSMLTPDVKPTRLERAKLALADLAEQLPGCRLGLIAFAGDAFLECPLTLDHEAFQNSVQELDTDIINRPGTDIGAAVDESVNALRKVPSANKILLLITDGEDLENRALDSAKKAAEQGIKIYTVGVGTPEGELIPEVDPYGNMSYHRHEGNFVRSKLDENMLRQIAQATGGAYVPLGQRGQGLVDLYNRDFAKLSENTRQERQMKIRDEQYAWPLSLAVLLLLIEFLLRDSARRRNDNSLSDATALSPAPLPPRRRKLTLATASVGLSLLLVFPISAAITDAPEQNYKSGKYDKAKEGYQKAAEQDPNDPEYQYDLGAAAYKTGDYYLAEDNFHRALMTPNLDLQERAYYNLGNSQFRRGEGVLSTDINKTISAWETALNSYSSALKLKQTADAAYNYQYVKRRLEELKEQKKQSEKNKNQNSGTGNNSDSSSDQSSSPNDNEANKNTKPNQPKDQGKPQDQSKPGDNPGQSEAQKQNQEQGQDKKNSQPKDEAGSSKNRDQDMNDPGAKSRQEAAAVLDSLKGEEEQLNSRSFNQPPPPATDSKKDW